MSPSEPVVHRKLVIDTETPGTEIFVMNAQGVQVAEGVRRLEAELPIGVYKIRFRIGDRVTDTLIELDAGSNPLYATVPPLPIISSAPPVDAPGAPTDHTTEFALRLIQDGPQSVHGVGGSLFVFVSPESSSDLRPPDNPAAGLSIHAFSGNQIADLKNATTDDACAGHVLQLDPGHYLLRAVLDGGAPIEQTVAVALGWQTRVYMRLIEDLMLPGQTADAPPELPTPGWKLDLPHTGIIMVRDGPTAPLGRDDARWTAAARQALAAGRGEAAPNRDMMRALLRGKFENPMLGIYAGHLLALQSNPDRELLREVYDNLRSLIGDHPDVQALLIALDDPQTKSLNYPEPPMLSASWALIVRAGGVKHDLRPKHSYSARVAASLWGSGAWLSWRMPPPQTETASAAGSPEVLHFLINEASSGRLEPKLNELVKRKEPLSAVERLLAGQLLVMGRRVQLAKDVDLEDSGSFTRYYRHVFDSDLLKQTKTKIAGEFNPQKLLDASGVPYSAVLDAASMLGRKLGVDASMTPGFFKRWIGHE
jgi:hypothetical protein